MPQRLLQNPDMMTNHVAEVLIVSGHSLYRARKRQKRTDGDVRIMRSTSFYWLPSFLIEVVLR